MRFVFLTANKTLSRFYTVFERPNFVFNIFKLFQPDFSL